MSNAVHSVEKHLAVSVEEYDAQIVRWIPRYSEMLDELCRLLGRLVAPDAHVLDLGAGTGALSTRVRAAMPLARLTMLDADPAMLEVARTRGVRADQVLQSFLEPLPVCDAAIASLALHHVREPAQKLALYRNIRASCAGPLLIADGYVDDRGTLADEVRRRWAEHLVANGDSAERAVRRFEEWAQEDRYFPVSVELARLREAGFGEVDVVWRAGPLAVLAALP